MLDTLAGTGTGRWLQDVGRARPSGQALQSAPFPFVPQRVSMLASWDRPLVSRGGTGATKAPARTEAGPVIGIPEHSRTAPDFDGSLTGDPGQTPIGQPRRAMKPLHGTNCANLLARLFHLASGAVGHGQGVPSALRR